MAQIEQANDLVPSPGTNGGCDGPDGTTHGRRTCACLAACAAYLVLCAVLLGGRLEAHRWGILLPSETKAAAERVFYGHLVAAIAFASLAAVCARIGRAPRFAPKLALAAVPVVITVSFDRLLSVRFPPIGDPQGLHVPHPTRGWTNHPGWSGLDGYTPVRFNRYGFRGPDFPLEKPAGEHRILFLGDSVTFGAYVNEEDVFVSRLQRRADDRFGPGRVRLINASVMAYSPWQEYDLLVNEGLPCQPDLIVQVFCLNDVLEKFQLRQFGGYATGFEPPAPDALEWSGLYRAARALKGWLAQPSREEVLRCRRDYSTRRLMSEPEAPDVRAAWDVTLEHMADIAFAARHRGIPLVIACAPHRDQMWPDAAFGTSPQERLARFAAAQGVAFLDLLPPFRARARENAARAARLFDDALHFSSAGHAVLAEAVDRFFADHGFWLPGED